MTVPELGGAGSGEKDIRVNGFDMNFGGKTLLSRADLHLVYARRRVPTTTTTTTKEPVDR
jgi:hypothetical protein